jgi:hypothetical protein
VLYVLLVFDIGCCCCCFDGCWRLSAFILGFGGLLFFVFCFRLVLVGLFTILLLVIYTYYYHIISYIKLIDYFVGVVLGEFFSCEFRVIIEYHAFYYTLYGC